MNNEIDSKRYKGYLITIYNASENVEAKFRAFGTPFGSAASMKAAFELPRFHKFGKDPDNLVKEVKSEIDSMDNND